MKRNLAMCFTFWLLYGCGSQPVVPAPPIVASKDQTVAIDKELLKKCQPMAKLTQPTYNQGQTVSGPVQTWANEYTECSRRQAALSDLVAKAFNINDAPASSATAVNK